jgi:transglutaminase-like putative cysteine protease
MEGPMSRRLVCSLALLLAGLIQPAWAQEGAPFKRWYTYDYVFRSHELVDVTARTETEVVAASAVQSLGQYRISNNDYFHDLEIVEAATIKADGRRIDVKPESIAEVNGSEGATNIYFQADLKTRVIPFPDLATGDRTVVVTRTRQKLAVLAGGATRMLTYPPSLRFEEAKVTIDAPAALRLHVVERDVRHDREEQGERVLLKWRVAGKPFVAEEPGAVSSSDWGPMIAFSSFDSWHAYGRQVFVGADPKSHPTPDVDKLAEEITRGISDRRLQAAAIYDWVARNIRYFQVVLGRGGMVPHDTAFILANRYGDCKDHASLMRALLLSKGIESEFVLINSGAKAYKAFDVPLPTFDHMILYVPEFDRYVDPTVAVGSFQALPASLSDRPVLRVGANGSVQARTPVLTPDSNSVELVAEATIRDDGSIVGRNKVIARGTAALGARGTMRQFEQSGGAEAVKAMLARQRWRGTATFDTRSPFDRADPYEVTSQFTFNTRLFSEGAVAVAVPSGLRLMGRPIGAFATVVRENRTRDFVCDSLSYSEKLTLTWPEGRKMDRMPKNVKVVRPLGEYEASYEQVGQSLRVSRRLVFRHTGAVCTRATANDMWQVSTAAARDFGTKFRMVEASYNGPPLTDDMDGETPN